MFTGIITDIGEIIETRQAGDLTLTIACAYPAEDIAIGESIACSGACLTVTSATRHSPAITHFTVQLSAETVSRTAHGMWEQGKKLSLERALRVGDRLGGHFVTGHVDGLARIITIHPIGDSHQLLVEAPRSLAHFIAPKGSVTLDGVSLTVNEMERSRFTVNIIPHTWQHTALHTKKPGDALNLEIDTLARYVARMMEGNAQ